MIGLWDLKKAYGTEFFVTQKTGLVRFPITEFVAERDWLEDYELGIRVVDSEWKLGTWTDPEDNDDYCCSDCSVWDDDNYPEEDEKYWDSFGD